MTTVKLNNGLDIPQIGVGTWTLLGETARQNVRMALEAGFRHIDTAQCYMNKSIRIGLHEFGSPKIKEQLTETHFIR